MFQGAWLDFVRFHGIQIWSGGFDSFSNINIVKETDAVLKKSSLVTSQWQILIQITQLLKVPLNDDWKHLLSQF